MTHEEREPAVLQAKGDDMRGKSLRRDTIGVYGRADIGRYAALGSDGGEKVSHDEPSNCGGHYNMGWIG